MGQSYDVLDKKLQLLQMNIFGNFESELSPFVDHLKYIFEMKENATVGRKTMVLLPYFIHMEIFCSTSEKEIYNQLNV